MEDRARASEEEDPTHQPQVPDEVADADPLHAVRTLPVGDRSDLTNQRKGPAVDEILDVGGMEIVSTLMGVTKAPMSRSAAPMPTRDHQNRGGPGTTNPRLNAHAS